MLLDARQTAAHLDVICSVDGLRKWELPVPENCRKKAEVHI